MSRQSVAKIWLRLGHGPKAGQALSGITLPRKITRHHMRDISLSDVLGLVKVELLEREKDEQEIGT